jgi:ATP-binding cassette subfamily C exporter for protease/lipase
MTSKTKPRSELRQTLWTFRHEFLIAGALSMLANVLMLAPTLYMLQVFDRVTMSRSELTLLALSLITLALFAVMGLAEWLRSRLLVRAGAALDKRLSTRVFNACFESNVNRIAPNPGKAFSDLLQMRQFITGQGLFALFDLPWAPVYLLVLFFLHPMLGWSAIFFAVVQGLLAWFGHRHTVAPAEAVGEAQLRSSNYLQSKLRNSEVVEAMGMGDSLKGHWLERHKLFKAKSSTAFEVSNNITAISKFIRYTQQSLVLGLGAVLVIEGELTAGAMIASNVLMGKALGPIDMLVTTWRGFSMAKSAFFRLEQLLRDFPDSEVNAKHPPLRGEVELKKVQATAAGRKTPILSDINVHIQPGEVMAIMGPSGSGKSTLAKVLLGIWPQVDGQVLLDRVDVQRWNRSELGPQVGYLPQDIELFEGTISENIARFGAVDPMLVIAAAMRTGLHETILRFPGGYDTPIGLAGSLLSGGQRQRLGLARAVYGLPSLIVLDEPNANLDDLGEAALNQTIADLKAMGRTVVLVTHRPAAVAQADRLMVVRDGHIQFLGATEEVLTQLHAAAAAAAAATQNAQGQASPAAAAA